MSKRALYQTTEEKSNRLAKPKAAQNKTDHLLTLGGTMIAHYTNGNVLTVKKLLGHKNISSTMKYIGMIHFKDNEFDVATATTVEEAKTILSAGYDYVTEKNDITLFRRPKRFNATV